VARAGVAGHVGQRFPHDVVGRHLDGGGERRQLPWRVDRHAQLTLALAGRLLA